MLAVENFLMEIAFSKQKRNFYKNSLYFLAKVSNKMD